MFDKITYRLAFVLPQSRQLLALVASDACELPQICIPMWERTAEQLTRAIADRWKLRTIVLDILPDETATTPCAVIEIQDPLWHFTTAGFSTVGLGEISSRFLSEQERAGLSSILNGGDAGRGPFSRIGWVEDAKAWIREARPDKEVSLTNDIRHLNAGGGFCLARFANDSGPAYWLKAVSGPNSHEYGITLRLSQRYPAYLPRIVATRYDWNAWVMEEFGTSLHNSNSLQDFKGAAVRLAALQKECVGTSDDLLGHHCLDHRVEILRQHIDEVIAYLTEAMEQQISRKVSPLGPASIKELRDVLHRTCDAFQELHIPDSVMHGDISPGSILSDGHSYVFTDWCEAYLGNPFITLEQMCAHVSNKTDTPEIWIAQIKNAYAHCWSDTLTEYQITTVLRLTPLISVFSHLYGRGDWLRTSRRNDAELMSYVRSLARHMDRLSQQSNFIEALC